MKHTDILIRAGAVTLALAGLTFAQPPPASSITPPAKATASADSSSGDAAGGASASSGEDRVSPAPATPHASSAQKAGADDLLASRRGNSAGSSTAGSDEVLRKARLRVLEQHLASARAEIESARKELPVLVESALPAAEARITALEEFCRKLEFEMKAGDVSFTDPGDQRRLGSLYDPFLPTDPRNADRLKQRIALYEAAYEAQARAGAAKAKGETVFIQLKNVPVAAAQAALEKRFKTVAGELVFGIVEITHSVWIGGDGENVKQAVGFLRALDELSVPAPPGQLNPNAPRTGTGDPLRANGYRSPGKSTPPAGSNPAPAPDATPPLSPQR